jgi:uncharacterized MAPEG superfamily protein
MSIAYWCVLVAALLPYFTVGVAKGKDRGAYDNADPRKAGTYSGLAHRAHGAHQNGFEAFPFFAAAVFVASAGSPHLESALLDGLALGWIALRLLYTWAYLGNRPSARSLIWVAGLLLTVAIFTMPAWHR